MTSVLVNGLSLVKIKLLRPASKILEFDVRIRRVNGQ